MTEKIEKKTRKERFLNYYEKNKIDLIYYFFVSFSTISLISIFIYYFFIKKSPIKYYATPRNYSNYIPVKKETVERNNIDFFEMVKTPPRRTRISDKLR